MDNRKLRNRFPIFVFILIALFGCELEQDAIQKNSYQEKVKIRRSTFDALLKERNFVNAFSKLSQGQNKGLQSKTVMEAEYGFTIMPNLAKVIESAGSTSYTFKITREINSIDYFENLVIDTDSLGQTNAYILKYTPSEPLAPAAHNSFNFTGRVKITPITYNTDEIGKTTICVTAQILMCDQAWSSTNTGVHVATNDCQDQNHLFYAPVTTCYSVNGDIGGGDFGDDPGVIVPIGGGGGDGSPPTNGDLTPPNNCPRCPIIITAPVEDVPPTPTQPNPCVKLGKLIQQKKVKSGLNHLKNNLETNLETVYSLEYDATNNSVSFRPGVSGTRSGVVRIFPTTFGAAHNHPVKLEDDDSSYPMFSADDLLTPYQIAMSSGFQPTDYPLTNLMVVPENTYALIPNDVQSLSILTSKFANEKSLRDFNSELRDLYIAKGKPWNVDQNTLAREFLKFVNQKYNLNISLFQMSNSDFYNNNNTWSEVKLDPTSPTGITKTPCN